MFHKRLMKEFSDNLKYVIGMVAAQWVSLLANVGMMLVMADFIGKLLINRMEIRQMTELLITFVAAFVIRMLAVTINTRQSFAASENVKRRLRE